jgi:hypothetical protein
MPYKPQRTTADYPDETEEHKKLVNQYKGLQRLIAIRDKDDSLLRLATSPSRLPYMTEEQLKESLGKLEHEYKYGKVYRCEVVEVVEEGLVVPVVPVFPVVPVVWRRPGWW